MKARLYKGLFSILQIKKDDFELGNMGSILVERGISLPE